VGVGDGVVVLGEAGGGDEVVDSAVLLEDLFERLVDRGGAGDIAEVGGDLGESGREGGGVSPGRLRGGAGGEYLSRPGFSFLTRSSRPLAERAASSRFMSTMATSAPEVTSAWAMTRPRPRAPPVTMATLPSMEKEARVRLKCSPPLPTTGLEGGRSFSSGYSTLMSWLVRAYWPSWLPDWPGAPEVVAYLTSSSTGFLLRWLAEPVKRLTEARAGWAARGAWARAARAAWWMSCDLNMVGEGGGRGDEQEGGLRGQGRRRGGGEEGRGERALGQVENLWQAIGELGRGGDRSSRCFLLSAFCFLPFAAACTHARKFSGLAIARANPCRKQCGSPAGKHAT